jgi:chorismate-pyruvate lyase
VNTSPILIPDLKSLVTLFGRTVDDVGQFEEVAADQLRPYFRQLLDHHDHMTARLEAACGCRVAVEVKRRRLTPSRYERISVLRDARGGRVLQYGVVRLQCVYLDETVREDIEEEQTPLGRILIQHRVLRRVQRIALWRIATGPELRRAFSLAQPTVTYGRTALIYCDGNPAIELLEILAPESLEHRPRNDTR